MGKRKKLVDQDFNCISLISVPIIAQSFTNTVGLEFYTVFTWRTTVKIN